jgi:hypothetical protein
MKKAMWLFLSMVFLSGCATYKFDHGDKPYEQGYVAFRDNYPIAEYTVGKDNTVPDLQLAKERFKRRKTTVDSYYTQMGYIENHFKETFINPPVFLVQVVVGVFRLPFIAMSDYKYNHNPAYKEKVLSQEITQEAKEQARIKALKEKLNMYIQEDLVSEEAIVAVKEKAPAPAPVVEPKTKVTKAAKKPKAAVVRPPKITPEARQAQTEAVSVSEPVAVIVAKPAKGYSPLTVRFYGGRSHSPKSRIIHYAWDFGDGDASNKENPVNMYYSSSFEPRQFNVTLTVTDNNGKTATAAMVIEVLNK